jgi:two-component system phosphate regulon sensor histidine kinase PhoR
MNRYFSIAHIVILMAVALSLLTGMQIYLLQGTYTGENNRFEQSVKEAMLNVRYRTERNHVEQQVNKRINLADVQQDIINSLDSLQTDLAVSADSVFNIPAGPNSELQTTLAPSPDIAGENPGRILERFGGNIQMLEENPDQLKSIFKDLLFGYLSYSERDLNIELIRTALNEELAIKGVETPFEIGVYNNFNNSFVHADNSDNALFVYSPFQVPLYYIGLKNAIMLSVHFPKKSQFIIQNILFLVVSTLLIILVIVLVFIYSVRIIYKQKRLSDMKNDLINNITHELKTPISIISLACQALNDEDMARLEGIRSNYLNVIAQENKRLGGLVENILQSAVMEKADLKLKIVNIHVHEKIENVLNSLKMRIQEKEIRVIKKLHANPDLLEADETHFINMLFNLLDNAIKYGKPEEKKATITIGTDIKEDRMEIWVEDEGIGISKDDQKKIFEKLYRVSTGNVHNVKGYGLGLNYVKSIVDHHKGVITVKSELGKGARFTVGFPLNQEKK